MAGALALALGARAWWPRLAGQPAEAHTLPAVTAPQVAAADRGATTDRGALINQGATQSPTQGGAQPIAPAAQPVSPATNVQAIGQTASALPIGPLKVGQTLIATPPIVFSLAKFQSDPALVAGAVSTGVPDVSGDSAIVVDVTGKEVIYGKQPFKHQLMASTAKIMTGIVAVEHSPLDKIITVPEEATEVEPNHMGIKAGEKLTLQELFYGMFLDSGRRWLTAWAAGAPRAERGSSAG